MAHLTKRGDPCGLKDDHHGDHRTEQGVANHNAAKRSYDRTEKGVARRRRWNLYHPVHTELAEIQYRASRRARM